MYGKMQIIPPVIMEARHKTYRFLCFTFKVFLTLKFKRKTKFHRVNPWQDRILVIKKA